MRRIALPLVVAALGVVGIVVGIRAADPPERAGAREGTAKPEARPGGADAAAGGRLVDAETGSPVPGARLTLYRVSRDLPEAGVVSSFLADELGRFPVTANAETDRLVVEAEGYPPQAFWLDPDGMEIRLSVGEDRKMRVVDDEGRAAAGALIGVFADDWLQIPLTTAETDGSGVATLRLTGDESLLVRLPGYAYEVLQHCVGREWPAEVALVPEYTIGGRIVDSAGKPIPGASVRLRQGSGCETFSEFGPTVLAGREGGFLFRGIHGCDCEMTVRADGYAERCVGAAPGDERMRIVMRRVASASGVVLMPDGSPARGANVQVNGPDGRSQGVAADAGGRFELTGLAPRRQEILASGDGELSARIEIAPAEGEAIGVLKLELGPPSRGSSFLRLQVLDGGGRAVPGASVAAHNGRGTTDRDGIAIVDAGAPPGFTTTIAITPPKEQPRRLIGTYVPAVTSPSLREAPVLDVVLHDGVFIRVEARGPDRTPLADASVELFRDGPESGLDVGNPVECEEGWFVDPNDAYLVRVRAKGFTLFETWRWSPRNSAGVFTATLRPCAAVKGRVSDSQGAPLDEIHATVDFHLDHMGMGQRATCGPDGSFLIEELEEGAGMLTVGRERGAPGAGVKITTESGRVTDAGLLVLVPHVVFAGRVVDSEARPLGGARVSVETGLPDCYRSTYSRADGTFRFTVPGFAQGSLLVRKGGLGTVRLPLAKEPRGALGDIAMPEPGAVEVDVDGVDWLVTEYVTLDIAWAATPTAGSADEGLYWRHDPRPYRIDDLAPGRYVVRLSVGDTSLQEEVGIVEGETAKLRFRLSRGELPR